jgi:hypothetical protein
MEGQRILDAAEHAKDVTPKDKEPPAPPPAESTSPISSNPPNPNIVDHAAGAEAAAAHTPQDPEALLKWIDARLAKITDPFELPDIWESFCLPKLEGAFPPDFEAAQAIYQKHETRLEP